MARNSSSNPSRRDVLRVGVLGLTGLSVASHLRLLAAAESGDGHNSAAAPKATADACIFVNLEGGPSHLDTLDMKPEGPSETRGEFRPIATSLPGLQACEYLPKFATIADQFCLLRGISHSAGAHPQAQAYISTGNRPIPALVYPSL